MQESAEFDERESVDGKALGAWFFCSVLWVPLLVLAVMFKVHGYFHIEVGGGRTFLLAIGINFLLAWYLGLVRSMRWGFVFPILSAVTPLLVFGVVFIF